MTEPIPRTAAAKEYVRSLQPEAGVPPRVAEEAVSRPRVAEDSARRATEDAATHRARSTLESPVRPQGLREAGFPSPFPNPSGITPLGRAILVTPWEPRRRTSAILLPPSVLANEQSLDVKVQVVECGPVAWPDETARAKAGDIVLVAKFSGFVAQGADGKPYRLVNDRDIFARLTVEAANG